MDYRFTRPAFPIGFPLNLGYLGLYRADEDATNRNGDPIPPTPIMGVRYLPDARETWPNGEDKDSTWTIEHPAGWEYQVAYFDRQGSYTIDGWWTEAELLEKGYVPPADPAERHEADALNRPDRFVAGMTETSIDHRRAYLIESKDGLGWWGETAAAPDGTWVRSLTEANRYPSEAAAQEEALASAGVQLEPGGYRVVPCVESVRLGD